MNIRLIARCLRDILFEIINETLESERKMQQNIVNENKYTGFGTKKTFSSITKIDKDSASERNPALEKSIEVFGNIGKTFGKMFILVIAGIFTVFPFMQYLYRWKSA